MSGGRCGGGVVKGMMWLRFVHTVSESVNLLEGSTIFWTRPFPQFASELLVLSKKSVLPECCPLRGRQHFQGNGVLCKYEHANTLLDVCLQTIAP